MGFRMRKTRTLETEGCGTRQSPGTIRRDDLSCKNPPFKKRKVGHPAPGVPAGSKAALAGGGDWRHHRALSAL